MKFALPANYKGVGNLLFLLITVKGTYKVSLSLSLSLTHTLAKSESEWVTHTHTHTERERERERERHFNKLSQQTSPTWNHSHWLRHISYSLVSVKITNNKRTDRRELCEKKKRKRERERMSQWEREWVEERKSTFLDAHIHKRNDFSCEFYSGHIKVCTFKHIQRHIHSHSHTDPNSNSANVLKLKSRGKAKNEWRARDTGEKKLQTLDREKEEERGKKW